MQSEGLVIITPSGDVIARDVPYETFLADYAGEFVEWVSGAVIKMSPVNERHDGLSGFLYLLLATFLELSGGGRVLQDPMVMRPDPDLPARQPDLQVLLPANLGILKPNQVDGPADLVVEIVSPESHRRDRVEKFAEYERGGVREYWIFDLMREDALFYVRNAEGLFVPREPDADGVYHSVVLEGFRFSVRVLWQTQLPGILATVQMVREMLDQA